MQQLFFVKKEKLEWREVSTPKIESSEEALVRPFAVAKCDLDDAFLFNNVDLKIRIGQALGLIDSKYKANFGDLLKGPFPFGHECVAQVVEVGDKVRNVKVGDVVSVPFQISCGTCDNCRRGYTATCNTEKSISTYGFGKHLEFGGAMSDLLKVPYADHMLAKIPDNVDPIAVASLSDNIPDAYRHIESLILNPNQSILIVSGKAKSVAIYSLILAKSVGVVEVDFVDNDKERLLLADKLGATNVFSSFTQLKKKYDVVIDASSTPKGLDAAFRSVRNYGTVSSSGIYIKKVSLSLIDMYAKGVNFKIGLANAQTDTPKVLDLIQSKNIDFGLATTRLDKWDNAVEAFLTDTTKVVVTRDKIHLT